MAQSLNETCDSPRFVEGMRQLASGVCIIATRAGGRRYGLTATAVCSLSAEPPAILACISHSAEAHDPVWEAKRLAIHVLAEDQIEIAKRFATARGEAKFADAVWLDHENGMPYLAGALASFECRVAGIWDCQTHSVFKCLVRSVSVAEGPPLIYRDRQFSGVSCI